ncbi:MAG: cya-5 [Microvirga sp.]|nr:cya-5 [Microvirga sp.]
MISYGTEGFPENVARRLRLVNFTAWCSAVVASAFALSQVLERKLWCVAAISALLAFVCAAVPLLHRFGSLAASLTLAITAYIAFFALCIMLGTDTGIQMNYLSAAGLAFLYVGTERRLFAAAFAVLAVVLIVALEVVAPRSTGLLSDNLMLGNFIASTIGASAILFATVLYALREADRAQAIAEREHARSEALLGNILPATVASRLKESKAGVIADKYDDASVLFADMAGFTARASDTTPVSLVHFLNVVFTAFDRLVESHGLEKIKTTGDSYMVLSGAPVPRPDHAVAIAELALDMLRAAADLHDPDGRDVRIRIGIASGPVVAGVIGTHKFFYDVWGDAVNVASRMESTGVPGKVQVSEEAYARLNELFELEARGLIDVHGKGRMATWFLLGRKGDRVQCVPQKSTCG